MIALHEIKKLFHSARYYFYLTIIFNPGGKHERLRSVSWKSTQFFCPQGGATDHWEPEPPESWTLSFLRSIKFSIVAITDCSVLSYSTYFHFEMIRFLILFIFNFENNTNASFWNEYFTFHFFFCRGRIIYSITDDESWLEGRLFRKNVW